MGDVELRHGRLIARFAVESRSGALPEAVALKTKLHIIDTLAAIVSGSALEAGLAGQRHAAGLAGREVAAILGTRLRAPLVEAALANGMAAHADESDDSHEDSQTHPGCAVLPAALAVAEQAGASGPEFLRAVNLGYEIAIRFGEAMAPGLSFARSSLSCHAYAPLFGAGFAAGSLMRFSAEQVLVLLNYLAQEASGLTTWRLDGSHTLKSYVFAGMPASNGVKAATLVRSGFTGSGDVLSPHDRNLFDALSPRMVPEALYSGLGTVHKILETDFKKYGVGFPIAAPVAALEEIIACSQISSEKVETLRVHYHQDWLEVVGDASRMPDLNLRYCLSATLIDGALSFAAAHDEARMSAPDVRALASRIEFAPAQPDQDRFEARIEVRAGGKVYRAAQGRHVLGRKEHPMSAEQVHAKASELLTTVLERDRAERAIVLVHALEEMPSIQPLVDTLSVER